MTADVLSTEGRRGVQRPADLEIPTIAAVNGPVSVHREYALLADVVIASDTTVFSDLPNLAFGIAPGDGPAPRRAQTFMFGWMLSRATENGGHAC
jgi:enoyl-CoA hydratase/carnithine racemase